MIYTIGNNRLTVSVSERGAELQSIQDAAGREYLWQGDPAFWSDRAIHIFPYVARLTEDSFYLDGIRYHMENHGFAWFKHFRLAIQTKTSLLLELTEDAETMERYPRRFWLGIHYVLEGATLQVRYFVENRDERTMYFGIGGHPGFRVPFEDGRRFEDYRLCFSEPCEPRRVDFTKACFVTGTDSPFPLKDGRILPLWHGLFDEDAIVLKQAAKVVSLCAENGPRLTVRCPEMPYLGLWHVPRTEAPYLCIEPWSSLPSRQDEIAVLETQKDLISLQPGKSYETGWSVEISEE